MISSILRKTQPAIAKVVGLANEQSLHHFLTQSPWQVQHLINPRLSLFIKEIGGNPVLLGRLCIKICISYRIIAIM
jgi:hypothetical protein